MEISSAERKRMVGRRTRCSLLTNHINPETFTIYTSESWQNLSTVLGLIPDEAGNVEILQQFWADESGNNIKQTVFPLLIYAGLMQSGFGRNIETAKLILENELSYIK